MKKLHEMNTDELLHRKKVEIVMGCIFACLSVATFYFTMYAYTLGVSLYLVILLLTTTIIDFLFVVDSSQNLNTISIHLYLREHLRKD